MEKDQKPPSENYCICTWRALKRIVCPDIISLNLAKRSFLVDSNGVQVKFIIGKDDEAEQVMREFAKLTEK